MSESRDELEARIAAYVDGELSPAEAARLEVFLANTDPALAEQVIGMLADKHAMKNLPGVRAPGDLKSRIMEQVERASLLNGVEHFSSSQRKWWQTRAAIAAAVFVVLGGFVILLLNTVLRPDSPWLHAISAEKVAEAPQGTQPEGMGGAGGIGPIAAAPAPAPMAIAGKAEETVSTPKDALRENPAAFGLAARSRAAGAAALLGGGQTVSAEAMDKLVVAQEASGRPLLMTLGRRDEQDAPRLQTAMAALVASDAASIAAQGQLQKKMPDDQVKTAASVRQLSDEQIYDAGRNGFVPAGAGDAAAVTTGAPGGAATQEAAALPKVVRYRVMLRPEQIAALAKEFRVVSVSGGAASTENDRKVLRDQDAAAPAASMPSPTTQAAGKVDDALQAKPLDGGPWVECIVQMEIGGKEEGTQDAAPAK